MQMHRCAQAIGPSTGERQRPRDLVLGMGQDAEQPKRDRLSAAKNRLSALD
jgi:hypothetical protein